LRTERTTELEKQDHVPLTEMSRALDLYFGGDMEAAIALTGQVMGRIEAIKPVQEIIYETIAELRSVISGLASSI
jgi:enoyl-[acyl-carrier protein] reductase II